MGQTVSFFFDTEFNDEIGGCRIDPISIGLVTEDDTLAYYGVSSEFNEAAAHEWLKANVIPKLPPMKARVPLVQLRQDITDFFKEASPKEGQGKAQIWGKNPGCDQAVLGLIFGGLSFFYTEMNKLGFNRTYFNDTDTLRTRLMENAIPVPRVPRSEGTRHTAIGDAIHERKEYLVMRRLISAL